MRRRNFYRSAAPDGKGKQGQYDDNGGRNFRAVSVHCRLVIDTRDLDAPGIYCGSDCAEAVCGTAKHLLDKIWHQRVLFSPKNADLKFLPTE
jgi:hypothetical protein